MNTFRDIIRAFGGGASLARQIGEKPVTVRAWGNRNSIPAEHWLDVERAATASGVKGVSVARMAKIASEHRTENAA